MSFINHKMFIILTSLLLSVSVISIMVYWDLPSENDPTYTASTSKLKQTLKTVGSTSTIITAILFSILLYIVGDALLVYSTQARSLKDTLANLLK